MPSTFTWLDTSERDRRRAMEVIDLFRHQDTRDELGIGTVRDALANLLMPGVSTIQTRAKYFLLVPWVYLRLERRRVASSDVARRARNDELRIAEALGASSDPLGTIGIEAGRGLKRLASSVYWGGLGTWGIRLLRGSVDQYHRSLDRFYSAAGRTEQLREDPESEVFHGANWHPHIPDAPDGFLDEMSFVLEPEEARYLQDRLQARVPESLLAFLARRDGPWKPVDFPWDESLLSSYREPLRGWVEHARCFSEVMHGAALLYNLMLAKALPSEERVEEYEEKLAGWQAFLGERAAALAAWDRGRFWTLVHRVEPRIPPPTRRFADRWMDFAIGSGTGPVSTPEHCELIAEREHFLKRSRARLVHREYLLMWGGAAGADALDYRWGSAQTIVNDILRGLRGDEANARAA